MLDAAEAGEDGVEKVEQDKGAVVVEEQLPVAGALALGADVVQALQQGVQHFEVLEPAQILGVELGFFLGRHRCSSWDCLDRGQAGDAVSVS